MAKNKTTRKTHKQLVKDFMKMVHKATGRTVTSPKYGLQIVGKD